MHNLTLLPMRPEWVVCPNAACGASGRIGIHSRAERRYKCHAWGKTFAETIGTPLYGLKHPAWVVVVVLALLASGCPIPAIVFVFGLDERTVADWQQKAGRHAQAIQEQQVCQGQVDLGQVQGDEL
jgi:transposase-like protein